MSNPTTPFSWQMPTATDLVTDLPADFEVFGQAVATSMGDLLGGSSGYILSKASATDMDFTWIANDQGDITGVTAGNGITVTSPTGPVPTIAIDTAVTVDKTTAQTLTNKTLTTPIILSISNTGTLTLPTSTDTLVGRATTDTLTNKTLTSPALTTPTISTATTNGDILYGTGSGALQRLGIGSASQVLTVASGVPSWATPASGGGMTLLSTTTLSGANVDINVASGYINLFVVIYGVTCSADYTLGARINNNTSGYWGNGQRSYNVATVIDTADSWFTGDIVGNSAKAADSSNTMTFTIENYDSASLHKLITVNATNVSPSSVRQQFNAQWAWNQTSAMTYLRVLALGPTFSTGTCLIYGVK